MPCAFGLRVPGFCCDSISYLPRLHLGVGGGALLFGFGQLPTSCPCPFPSDTTCCLQTQAPFQPAEETIHQMGVLFLLATQLHDTCPGALAIRGSHVTKLWPMDWSRMIAPPSRCDPKNRPWTPLLFLTGCLMSIKVQDDFGSHLSLADLCSPRGGLLCSLAFKDAHCTFYGIRSKLLP